jgi:hypothetical protein
LLRRALGGRRTVDEADESNTQTADQACSAIYCDHDRTLLLLGILRRCLGNALRYSPSFNVNIVGVLS